MQEHDGFPFGIPALLKIQVVHFGNAQTTDAIGLYRRVESAERRSLEIVAHVGDASIVRALSIAESEGMPYLNRVKCVRFIYPIA